MDDEDIAIAARWNGEVTAFKDVITRLRLGASGTRDRFVFHCLRHTFASFLAKNGYGQAVSAPTIFPVSSDAFSFLRDKRIDKLNKEQARQLHNNIDSEGQNVFAEMFSTGAGGYAGGNTIAPAEIQPRQRREGLPADLEIFAAVVAELNKLEAEAGLRELSNETSQIPTSGGERWRYLDYALKAPREVVIGDVLLGNRWWCLVEFQQRATESCNMGLLTRSDGDKISDTTLIRVLRHLPEVKGVWKNINLSYYKKEA